MNAPLLWIIFPALIGVGLIVLRRRANLVTAVAAGFCFFLALVAWQIPPGSALHIGPLSISLTPEFNVLGRRFVLATSDRSFLILMYFFGGIWFLGARQAKALAYFPAVGLVLIALLVAAQAVEPFLYSALILEMAVLVSLPLLSPPGSRTSGTLRFLVFQTLAVPFILLAGWAAGLVEANLPGTRWVAQAILFLGLGFAFWLAIFPFYTWVPLLAEESSPYVFGFLMGLLPVGILWIALGFLDSFAWLRSSVEVAEGLRLTGGIMVLTAGVWTAFQTDLSRMLGYAILMENGFALMAISLQSGLGLDLFAASLLPRLVGIALWTLALAIFQKNGCMTTLSGLNGTLKRYPVISAGLALAYFSLGGLPLLASFPIRQPLLEALAGQALPVTLAAGVGSLGFLFAGYRLLTAMASSEEKGWKLSERRLDAAMIVVAMAALILAGIFPWVFLRNSAGLVQVFTHLH
jgi:NADH-quinone oxidoreductase subunit N